jgi:hypothetical protein
MILDYAGPRRRSQFRLASRSLLDLRASADEGAVVREWLAGQGRAVAAIVTSALLFVLLGWVTAVEWDRTPWPLLAIPIAVIVGGVALVPMVIQQSWSETVLRAWDGTLTLRMGGPLARRHLAWQFDEVDAVRVIVTQSQAGAQVLGEIEIIAARTPPVRLFTDHPEAELSAIHLAVERVMKGMDPTVAAAVETAAVATEPTTPGVRASTEAEQLKTVASLSDVVGRTRGRGHRR